MDDDDLENFPVSEPCPHCGAPVPKGRKFCRACGSDASTGFAEDADEAGIELPEELSDEQYQQVVKREVEAPKADPTTHYQWILWITLIVLAFIVWGLA